MIETRDRLGIYLTIGGTALLMLILGSPIGNTGVWIGTMLLIGMGCWVEMSNFEEEEDEDEEL